MTVGGLLSKKWHSSKGTISDNQSPETVNPHLTWTSKHLQAGTLDPVHGNFITKSNSNNTILEPNAQILSSPSKTSWPVLEPSRSQSTYSPSPLQLIRGILQLSILAPHIWVKKRRYEWTPTHSPVQKREQTLKIQRNEVKFQIIQIISQKPSKIIKNLIITELQKRQPTNKSRNKLRNLRPEVDSIEVIQKKPGSVQKKCSNMIFVLLK